MLSLRHACVNSFSNICLHFVFYPNIAFCHCLTLGTINLRFERGYAMNTVESSSNDYNNPSLEQLIKNGTVNTETLTALLERSKEMDKRRAILEKHPIHEFKSGPDKGKFWVKIDGKKMQSISRERLEKKIIERCTDIESEQKKTFEDVFHIEMQRKINLAQGAGEGKFASTINTVARYEREFKNFFQPYGIAAMPITDITDLDIEEWLQKIIEKGIKKKRLKSITSIASMVFRRAMKLKLIKADPLAFVEIRDYLDYCQESSPIEKRAYSDRELRILMRECHRWQEAHPTDSRAWAYELNLLMAPRKGELPVLRWSDIQDGRIIIWRRQVFVESTGAVTIRNMPKNGSIRYYPVTDMIHEFLDRLKKRNSLYYPDHELLFPSPGREYDMIRPGSLYQFHLLMCKSPEKDFEKIPVIPGVIRGPHAFRRTHESGIMDAGGSRELAGKVYGNTEQAILQHYELSASADAAAPLINQVQCRIFSKNPDDAAKSEPGELFAEKKEIARAR